MVTRLGKHTLNVLEQITRDSEIPIREIRLLTREEERQILMEFNKKGDFVRDKTVIHLVEKHALQTPDRTAVVYRDTVLTFAPELSVLSVVPSVDDRKWFLVRRDRYNSRFEVYDVASDSIIFREYLTWGGVDVEVSPSGKYAFYTEMGDLTTWPGPSHFTVYDIECNRIRMLVSTIGILDGLNPSYWPLGEIAITPDGRWLIAGRSVGDPSFIRFNLTTMEIDDYVQLTGNGGVGHLTCQPSL